MKVVTVIGTRPQFIKAAPVSRALQAAGIEECQVDSGQHYDDNMAGIFLRELGLRAPAHALGVGSASHGVMTARILIGVERVLQHEQPDAVLVYGDTNTTLAGALAAAKLGFPVVHVEAGLRSRRPDMPEEINRRLTDQLARLLLCPTATGVRNLKAEGLAAPDAPDALFEREASHWPRPHAGVYTVNIGDVMVDALRWARSQVRATDAPLPGAYVLVTVHRAESTDAPATLAALVAGIEALGRRIAVLLPLHPRTRAALLGAGLLPRLQAATGVHIVAPMGYLAFVAAQTHARAVVTDSGGVQKEACILGVPCLTLRAETEWPETVTAGWNRLLGPRPVDLADAVLGATAPAHGVVDCFGDGHAAERVAGLLDAVVRR